MKEKLKKVFLVGRINNVNLFFFSILFLILSLLELFGIGLVGLIIERVVSNNTLSLNLNFLNLKISLKELDVYLLVGLVYFIKTLLAILINFIIYKYALYKTSDLRINIVSSYFANFNNLYIQNNNETINSINNYCEDFYQIFFLVHRLLSDLILAIALFIYLSLINVYIFIFFILSAILFIFSYNKLIKLTVRFGFNVNESRYSITKN